MNYLHWPSMLWPLATFAFIMSITPGPNNMMLLTSGARFGLRRTLPHVFGITGGVLVLLALAAAGVGAVLLAHPLAPALLAASCAAYMGWLAWQLLRRGPMSSQAAPQNAGAAHPLRWLDAALFQLANPKAWAMAIPLVGLGSGISASAPAQLSVTMVVFAVVNLPCIVLWALLGSSLRRWLSQRWISIGFNALMALLMVATGAWMLLPFLR